jgi:hypothetical protein
MLYLQIEPQKSETILILKVCSILNTISVLHVITNSNIKSGVTKYAVFMKNLSLKLPKTDFQSYPSCGVGYQSK